MSKSIKDLSINFWRQEAGGRRRLSFSLKPEKDFLLNLSLGSKIITGMCPIPITLFTMMRTHLLERSCHLN
jgi:hypothetical protein